MKLMKYPFMIMVVATTMLACSKDDSSSPTPPTPPAPTPAAPVGKHLTQNCNMPADASEQTVTLTGLTAEVTRIDGSADWLTTTKIPYTGGTPQVQVACQQNLSTEPRIQAVTFMARSDASTNEYFVLDTLVLTITQTVYQSGTDIDDPNDIYTDQPSYTKQH